MLGVVCHYCTEYGETRRDFLARRHSGSHTRNQSPVPSASLPRGPTTDIQDVRGQRHCRVVLFLVRQQQQLSPKETPRNVYSTSTITTSCLVPYMARHSGPSIDAALVTRNTERNKRSRAVEIRSQCVSIRTPGTTPHVFPPLAGIVSSLRPEMPERGPRSDLRLQSDRERTVRPGSVTSFLPRRPRGAYIVVLSSVACKVGRRIRHRGFLVGWYDLTLDPAQAPL